MAFLMLYVREAHPGDRIPEHHSMEEKTHLPGRLIREENKRRQMLVDDLEGTAHRAYGSLPNMIYFIDEDGRVLFRADWNNHKIAASIIERIAQGELVAGMRARFRPVAPPVLFRVLLRAGWDATFDFLISLPNLMWQHLKVGMRYGPAE